MIINWLQLPVAVQVELITYRMVIITDLKITVGHQPISEQFAKLADQGFVCSDKASDHIQRDDNSNERRRSLSYDNLRYFSKKGSDLEARLHE